MRTLSLFALMASSSLLGACVIEDSGDDTVTGFCGDGYRDPGEQCDDGNATSGDGCSATCTSEVTNGATITANWALKNANGQTTSCPTGFDTAALYSQPVDANGNNVGSPIIDLFDCVANTGTSAPLSPGLYASWIEIANHDNTQQYAKSLSAYVDLTSGNKTFSAQILNDGGYFHLSWNLVGAQSNSQLTCAQAGATGGVEATATDVSSSTNSASDQFNCEDGDGYTAGYAQGTYTVSVAALNSADQSIGTAPALTNKTILPKNQVTELGTVNIPIDGH